MGQPKHLWRSCLGKATAGVDVCHVGESKGRQGLRAGLDGRSAELTIRAAPIQVRPPRGPILGQRVRVFGTLGGISVEEHPPKDIEPVEWMLITSLEVKTLAQAQNDHRLLHLPVGDERMAPVA